MGNVRLEVSWQVDNLMAPNGHFLGQIPHPIHRLSEMKAILDSGVTSMQRCPLRTTGHDFLHLVCISIENHSEHVVWLEGL